MFARRAVAVLLALMFVVAAVMPAQAAMSLGAVTAHSPDDLGDIAGLATFAGDDVVQNLTLPLTFTVEGVGYTQIQNSNGLCWEVGYSRTPIKQTAEQLEAVAVAMKRLDGRVAVVTGGASGIGRALAETFGAEGMKVVLADVEPQALEATAREIRARGVQVLAVETDVTKPEDVRRLAQKTLAAFGGVHVVCNNAGVFAGGLCWTQPVADYEWVLGVNMWGVIHGIRTFVPIMLERGEEGHIVNTASMAALTANPYAAAYHMSKHAVLALSEVLYHELRGVGAKIGVSALCPEAVATKIDDCERNRPSALRTPGTGPLAPDVELVNGAIKAAVAGGIPTSVIADRVLRAVKEDRFYVLSDADAWRRSCESRLDDIRLARNPTFVPPV